MNGSDCEREREGGCEFEGGCKLEFESEFGQKCESEPRMDRCATGGTEVARLLNWVTENVQAGMTAKIPSLVLPRSAGHGEQRYCYENPPVPKVTC